jgi:long-subunit acyl-CoA synthetase (AMP-forming)
VQDIFNIPVLNYYGLTETAGIVLGEKTGHRAQTNLPPPCEGVEVVLQSVEDSPTTFQLHVKSDNLFLGYLGENLYRRTSFHTGDLVRPAGKGGLTLIGRATEAVKSPSTEWIFPSLLENWLKERAYCTDAVVHGVPIPGGHGLEAWVDTRESFNRCEIEEAISATIGSDYRPVAWHQAEIVRNALGKIERLATKS